jgi:ATP-dependent helicase/nuclease subunit B
METFTGFVANHLISEHIKELDRRTVVFPNRRAGLYLRKELAAQAGKTLWMPQILSIEEAFSYWSGYHQADPLSIVFDLMEIHLESNPANAEDMNSFASYAMQMAKDFDETDHYLVDQRTLFNYLSETKAMELWHPDGSPLTSYEKNYLDFFRSLFFYYENLAKKTDEKKIAASGAIAAKLAKMPIDELKKIIGNQKIIFAGFNALTPAEEVVITNLVKEGLASILWDVDSFYMNRNAYGEHEAGAYLRKFSKKNPGLVQKRISNRLLENEKKIRVIGVPGNVGQAKAMGHFLDKTFENTNNNKSTALVLADEKLLVPVLNSIPEVCGKFNVTMGLPFIYSPVYQYIVQLFDLAVFGSNSQARVVYPLRPLVALLQHEIISNNLPKKDSAALSNLAKKLVSDGSAYVKAERLAALSEGLSETASSNLKKILTLKNTSPQKGLENINEILSEIISVGQRDGSDESKTLLTNQINLAGRLINRLIKLISGKDFLTDLPGIYKLFLHIAPSYSVNFYGEPLQGLQVMGVLETRNLDFDCIHLLSANEGILPSEKGYQSLIPFDLKKAFGLPTYIDKQGVYAFHFYYMLQSAKEVFIYYNTEPDNLGGGEMSRFVLQLKYELSQLNPQITFSEEVFSLEIPPQPMSREISIRKTPEVLELLRKKALKGLAPTTLSRYVSCPLQFYLQDVLDIKEKKKANEIIGLNVLGTVVHNTLEILHRPYLNIPLQKNHFGKMISGLKDALLKSFESEFPGGFFNEGRNRLASAVAEQFVQKALNYESSLLNNKDAELVVLHQEVLLETRFDISGNTVRLKGTADRIDKLNNEIRIIDYKTGKVDPNDIKVKDWEELKTPKKGKALQLATYLYLYSKSDYFNPSESTISGILSLRKTSEGLMECQLPAYGNSENIVAEIETTLTELLTEIFDSEKEFVQTEDEKLCKFCLFAKLCMRE